MRKEGSEKSEKKPDFFRACLAAPADLIPVSLLTRSSSPPMPAPERLADVRAGGVRGVGGRGARKTVGLLVKG